MAKNFELNFADDDEWLENLDKDEDYSNREVYERSFSPPLSPSFLEIADDESNEFDEENIECSKNYEIANEAFNGSDSEEIRRPVKKESSKSNPFNSDDEDYDHEDHTEQSTDWLQKLQTCPKTPTEIIQAQWIIINYLKVRWFHLLDVYYHFHQSNKKSELFEKKGTGDRN